MQVQLWNENPSTPFATPADVSMNAVFISGVSYAPLVMFRVFGQATPAGSKISGQRADGSRYVRDASGERGREWRSLVRLVAREAMKDRGPFDGPLFLQVEFDVLRPKSHFGKRGLLPSAPICPAVRPDITKLLRGVEDALTGIVWRDDAQIVGQVGVKKYGKAPTVTVFVGRVEEIREEVK